MVGVDGVRAGFPHDADVLAVDAHAPGEDADRPSPGFGHGRQYAFAVAIRDDAVVDARGEAEDIDGQPVSGLRPAHFDRTVDHVRSGTVRMVRFCGDGGRVREDV